MTHGQFYSDGKCLKCGSVLPVLKDDHGWGIEKCPTCIPEEWYDTQRYVKAGGKFHNSNVCTCEVCRSKSVD